jgi:steroid 5-alpha reductase family enzyme
MADLILMVFSGWAIVALVFLLLWRLAVVQRNAGWVDVGWSFTLVLLVAWYAIWADGIVWRRLFYFLLAAFWGLRLAWHILSRLRREHDEDPRYRELRQHWGEQADRNFFFFFQAQGFANLLLAAPILLLMQGQRAGLSVFDVLGALLMLGAVFGESVADRQLIRWKADPANRGKTCRKGLWAVSRHPNYFFEWLHWLAWPVLALVLAGSSLASWWPVTLLGPAIMLVLLLQFTGIPYTEKQAVRSRGEDYKKYQREVSKFFPWFVRKEQENNP